METHKSTVGYDEAIEITRDVKAGKTRSYVRAAIDLERFVLEVEGLRLQLRERVEQAAEEGDHDELPTDDAG